jgi:hypothetical protein
MQIIFEFKKLFFLQNFPHYQQQQQAATALALECHFE